MKNIKNWIHIYDKWFSCLTISRSSGLKSPLTTTAEKDWSSDV